MTPTARQPARLNAGEREAVGIDELVVAPLPSIRTPDCRVECASQLRPPNVGEVRNALRDAKPADRSCAAPRSSTASTWGENDESWTATRP